MQALGTGSNKKHVFEQRTCQGLEVEEGSGNGGVDSFRAVASGGSAKLVLDHVRKQSALTKVSILGIAASYSYYSSILEFDSGIFLQPLNGSEPSLLRWMSRAPL